MRTRGYSAERSLPRASTASGRTARGVQPAFRRHTTPERDSDYKRQGVTPQFVPHLVRCSLEIGTCFDDYSVPCWWLVCGGTPLWPVAWL